jgi:hypothetical protein
MGFVPAAWSCLSCAHAGAIAATTHKASQARHCRPRLAFKKLFIGMVNE